MITGLEMVMADGSFQVLSKDTHPDFNNYLITFGAMGVVTSMTIKLEPQFSVTKEIYENLSFDSLFQNIDKIMVSPDIDYLSLFTTW